MKNTHLRKCRRHDIYTVRDGTWLNLCNYFYQHTVPYGTTKCDYLTRFEYKNICISFQYFKIIPPLSIPPPFFLCLHQCSKLWNFGKFIIHHLCTLTFAIFPLTFDLCTLTFDLCTLHFALWLLHFALWPYLLYKLVLNPI